MTREFPPSPNTTSVPVRIAPEVLSSVAKTGCRSCHGAGYVRTIGQLVRKGPDGKPRLAQVVGQACPPEVDRNFAACVCVLRLALGRLDIVTVPDLGLCWAASRAPADATIAVPARTSSP